jgi:hypothetical protein
MMAATEILTAVRSHETVDQNRPLGQFAILGRYTLWGSIW